MSLTRRQALPLLAAVLGLSPAAVRAASDSDPGAPIEALYVMLEKLMRAGQGTPFPQRYHMALPVITKVFDLETILSTSVGLRWGSMAADSRATLSKVYRRFTAATYVANFDSYEGERFEVEPETRSLGADKVVASKIIPTKGDPIRLDYVMRHSAEGWRVVDVLLDGTISRVAVQRSDFRGILAHGDVPALIASLDRKIADLSGGTLES